MTYQQIREYELTPEDQALIAEARHAWRVDFTYLEEVMKEHHRIFCACGNTKQRNMALCVTCRHAAPAHSG